MFRLSWGCDNIKAKNIFILSQTEPWEILLCVTILTHGYNHAHNTMSLVYISVRVAKSRAHILYTNMLGGGGGVVCKVIFLSNPTKVMLG